MSEGQILGGGGQMLEAQMKEGQMKEGRATDKSLCYHRNKHYFAHTFPQCVSVRAFMKLFLETARSAITHYLCL